MPSFLTSYKGLLNQSIYDGGSIILQGRLSLEETQKLLRVDTPKYRAIW